MQTVRAVEKTDVAPNACRTLRVCSYEDRPEAMDGLLLMAESLCRVDCGVSLHLTVPGASAAVRTWAAARPEVVLSTDAPAGVRGWDVKPWLLLQELNAGRPEALWIDADIIVTRPVSPLVAEVPPDSLVVAEEWNRPEAMRLTDFWDLPPARAVAPVNSCFLRATHTHEPLLRRWLAMTRDSGYRAAQALPFQRRPFHLASDQVLLTALLGSVGFGDIALHYIRMGRHIAQCAGSSGYGAIDRLLDLFRGLPPLIHCIGRKPWECPASARRADRFLTDFATDVSPYVLAARKAARGLGMTPEWLAARTWPGAILRALTAYHPGMAGLPVSILHALHMKMGGSAG